MKAGDASRYVDMSLYDLLKETAGGKLPSEGEDHVREVFQEVLITQDDIDAALGAGMVLPHGLFELASARYGMMVPLNSDFAEQP